MGKLFVIVIVILIASSMLLAQENSLKDYQGHVSYRYDKYADGYEFAQKYTQEEEALMKTKLEKISNYLQTTPILSNPKGIEVKLVSIIAEKSFQPYWGRSLRANIGLKIFPWFMLNGKPEYKCIECESEFTLHINQPERIFEGMSISGGDDLFDANGIVMNQEPVLITEQDGCKIFENQIVVISNFNKPLWLPVSVREYNEATIRKFEKRNKEKPDEIQGNNMMIAAIKKEMSSFSAEELNKPAFIGDKFGGVPYKLESEQARAIVKLNPELIDNKKAKTAFQLIVLYSSGITKDENNNPYFTDENSSYQAIMLAKILKSLKYSDLKKFFD